MMRKTQVLTAAATALFVALSGCQAGERADKAGGETTTLRLASIDKVNGNGQAYGPQSFVENLTAVSGGKLRVEVVDDYGGGAADAESNLVSAIATGDVDGGWPATRAFAAAGISGLEVVEAPMTITSYAAEKALASSPVADRLLSSLDGSGVVGLGLAVGPLRRPFAADSPLLDVQDWKGIRFRAYNSPVQSDAITLLGAVPVEVGFGWVDQVRAGTLRGVELDVAQYDANGYSAEAGNVTANVVLWPKMFVLSISQTRFDALTERERGWVREAAGAAVQASIDADYDENVVAQRLCDRGVRFHQANQDQLNGLRAAVQPAVDRLQSGATTGPLLSEIQEIAAQFPGAEAPIVPEACSKTLTGQAPASDPTDRSSLPDGTYRVEITKDDVAAAALGNGDGWSGTWTLVVEDATYELSCDPIEDPGSDCGETVSDVPLEVGDLRGDGQTVSFVDVVERLARATGCTLPPSQTLPGHCYESPSYEMTWELSGDRLTFSDYRAESWPNDQYVIEAWTRIG